MSVTDVIVVMTAAVVNGRYDRAVVRWEPNARGRLEQAAMELYSERGFESTTVAEIAERAGLTERTFFRHFSDKREVLFYGANALRDFLVREVGNAPRSLNPVDTVVAAFVEAAKVIFEDRREFARRRQAIIAANEDLMERELTKLARLSAELAEALRRRGVGELHASLAAESGISVFKIAFGSWVDDADGRHLSRYILKAAKELNRMTAARGPVVGR
jgi:AcrR family transcriptional regulator